MWEFAGTRTDEHAKFRGFRSELAFGQRPDGIVHISEVPSGLACDCTCPGCGDQLIARKGPKTIHHFAHHGKHGGGSCAYAAETYAHLWAKAVLMQVRKVWLPKVIATIDGKRQILRREEPFAFDRAVSERKFGGVVPDIVLYTGTRKLIVEIFVTHRCGRDKVAAIRAMDTSAIQIDLRTFASASGDDKEENERLRKALLWGSPREWLHNADQKDLIEQHRLNAASKTIAPIEPVRYAASPVAVAPYLGEPIIAANLPPSLPDIPEADSVRHVSEMPDVYESPLRRLLSRAFRWLGLNT